MSFMGKWFARILSLSLATACVVTLQPIMPAGQQGTSDPAKAVVAEADAKAKEPSVISEVKDGNVNGM